MGHTFTLGTYEQDGVEENGKEPILWRVLAANEKVELLLSELALEARPYHGARTMVGWADCALRSWLNGAFLAQAFDEDERARIHEAALPGLDYRARGGAPMLRDRVFLLSAAEVAQYLQGTPWIKAGTTERLRGQGAFVDDVLGTCRWWLRSPASFTMTAGFVESDGTVNAEGTNFSRETLCVRPALFRRVGRQA